ncbi:DUF2007 domain-containing protein [Rehaibacterium terrae]|uniref:DUF2007 domain-containing protein n=1 Tax=Rehaibacterium terrae TaxID=1341696 RepID=A0A7W8DFH1_9GAMM|nr:DUF2007 domain-containing protein [Rehaibacterium terrae]MBB5016517.1 hypothetical protein [Rehaibacterium terrae]
MRVVYEAENLIDAHLVRGALEEAGIPAWVRGEFLTGAMGELPVGGLVAVCVPASRWPEASALLPELLCRPGPGETQAADEGVTDPDGGLFTA